MAAEILKELADVAVLTLITTAIFILIKKG